MARRLLVGCLLVVAGFAHAGEDWWDAKAKHTAASLTNKTNASPKVDNNFTVQNPIRFYRSRGVGFYEGNIPSVNTTNKKLAEAEDAAITAEEVFNETTWNLPELKYNSIARGKHDVYRKFVRKVRKSKLQVGRKSSLVIPGLDGPFEPDQSELKPNEEMLRLFGPKAKDGDTYIMSLKGGCPDDCSGHGQCQDSKCTCNEGYTYYNCAMRNCVHGKWGIRKVDGVACPTCEINNLRSGTCLCEENWQGEFCDQKMCPIGSDELDGAYKAQHMKQCSAWGRCANGTCECNPGHEGKACETPTCSSHGDWNAKNLLCDCYPNWSGDGCEVKACPTGINVVTGEHEVCSMHGDCSKKTGDCKCHHGFEGVTCCPLGCHKHGMCREGQCRCKHGWGGPACLDRLMKTCPSTCFAHGQCEDGTCVCKVGYFGADCTLRRCENNCQGPKQGFCDITIGQCKCKIDWTGSDCSVRKCAEDCQADKSQPPRGTCVRGLCECQKGYQGLSCGQKSCPADCSGHGRCNFGDEGICSCDYGYAGANCTIVTIGECLNNCTGHGDCKFGECECDFGFMGGDCSRTRCVGEPVSSMYNATTNGCDCKVGYSGKHCQTKDSPLD